MLSHGDLGKESREWSLTVHLCPVFNMQRNPLRTTYNAVFLDFELDDHSNIVFFKLANAPASLVIGFSPVRSS